MVGVGEEDAVEILFVGYTEPEWVYNVPSSGSA
jgi:hypothetical protein